MLLSRNEAKSVYEWALTSWGYHSTQHPKKRAILPHPLSPLELYALLSNSPTAKPPKITSIPLHFHYTHPKKSHFFFLMFKLKFEAYIFPKFNTEPQLNRRIVKLFSHIELTLTTLFKLLLSFLSTIFSGTKHGIRKNKENNF